MKKMRRRKEIIKACYLIKDNCKKDIKRRKRRKKNGGGHEETR